MGILFSRFKNNETSVEEQKNAIYYYSPATSFVVNHYLENSPIFENTTVECCRGIYASVKEGRIESVIDTFVECVKKLIEWFKKWFIKFKNFIKANYNKIVNYFFKGGAAINRFLDKQPAFEPFTIRGYKYTIHNSDLNSNLLYNYMDQVDEEIINILNSDANTLDPRVARAKTHIASPETLDKFRGLLINRPPIDAKNFRHVLKHVFRNNNLKEEIYCDMTTVTGFCHEYKLLEKALESVKANRDQIGKHINRIIQFLHDEPDRYFNDYDKGNPALAAKKQMGIGMVYSSANLVIKQLNFIYDFYFTAKIDAIYEAMQFYVKIVTRALQGNTHLITKESWEYDIVLDCDIYSNKPIIAQTTKYSFLENTQEYQLDRWKSGEIKLLFVVKPCDFCGDTILINKLANEYKCRKVDFDFYKNILKKENISLKGKNNDSDFCRMTLMNIIKTFNNERTIIVLTKDCICDLDMLKNYAIIIDDSTFFNSGFNIGRRC